jgi:hypothetical protein
MAVTLAGASQVKKGFCFDAAGDEAFALGWPHIRRTVDVPVDHKRFAAQRLLDTQFDLAIDWPHDLAASLVHSWGTGALFDMAPGSREFRKATLMATWRTEAPSVDEVRSYIAARMERSPPWSSDRATESFVLLMEALTTTEWVLDAILDALESLSLSQLHEPLTQPAWITFQLGYLLLRVPEAKAKSSRTRMQALVRDRAGVYEGSIMQVQQSASHVRSLLLVLQGAPIADRFTDRGVRWYTHAVEHPKTVQTRVANHPGGGNPDVRLAWLSDPDILHHPLYQRYPTMPPRDQLWFQQCLAPVKHPEAVGLMAKLLRTSARQPALDWLKQHADYAKPLLEEMSARRKSAKEALALLG